MARTKFTTNPTFLPHPKGNGFKDLTGRRFGRSVVLGFAGLQNRGSIWHCQCDCGSIFTTRGNSLSTGNTTSCGCLREENRQFIHGENLRGNRTPEYRAYHKAKARCQNPNVTHYHRYGGRGIEFRFDSYKQFLEHVGRRPSALHTLDRINNEGHYEIDNVRWATRKEQNLNKCTNRPVTVNGETRMAAQWDMAFGVSVKNIQNRLDIGWCEHCAVTVPVGGGTCEHRVKT